MNFEAERSSSRSHTSLVAAGLVRDTHSKTGTDNKVQWSLYSPHDAAARAVDGRVDLGARTSPWPELQKLVDFACGRAEKLRIDRNGPQATCPGSSANGINCCLSYRRGALGDPDDQ